MAKKKKPQRTTETSAVPSVWKPPTPAQERRSAAEHFARVVVDTDAEERRERKQKINAITQEVMKVASQKLE